MCNNNGLCGCLNNNWWWIVILILLLCNCGGWNGCENGRPFRAPIHILRVSQRKATRRRQIKLIDYVIP